ncbi:hypothetical protein Dimus_022199 [Dionaea muscipula]
MAFPQPPPAEFLFQNHAILLDHQASPTSLSSQAFQGVPLVSMMKRSSSQSMTLAEYNDCNHHHNHYHHHTYVCEEVEVNHGDEELSDDGSQVTLGEKKKRLSIEQVKALENSFELGNKLEPERKMQLAKALCLKPRQVAIWFQNRRARWKTKQLEKDYNILKSQFDALQSANHTLQTLNKTLYQELVALKNREPAEFQSINLNAETKSYWSCTGITEITSDTNNLDTSVITPANRNPLLSSPLSIPQAPTFLVQTQFPQSSPDRDIQCPKLEHTMQDDSSYNFLSGAGRQPAFWPWTE